MIRSISALEDLSGKIVLVRVDFNIPVINGKISDYTRINSSLDTIKFLQNLNAKIVLISHFGRPHGKIDPALSLSFLVPELTRILKSEIYFSLSNIGHEPKKIIERMKDRDVLLLENIRFYQDEENNDEKFAAALATLGDIYVNDAFACSHRKHASIVRITDFLPAYAGLLLQKELNGLKITVDTDPKLSMAIIGGKKISTKIAVLGNLTSTMNKIAIAGSMANTFLKAAGHEIGASFYEPEWIEVAYNLLANHGEKIVLPCDFVCGELPPKAPLWKLTDIDNIHKDDIIFDIGPRSCFEICKHISTSKAVLWNGPLGAFEYDEYSFGTKTVARFIASLTLAGKITSVAGGGDTIAAFNMFEVSEHFSYTSTAGGAFLEWLEGKNLPGIEALAKNYSATSAN